MNILKFENKFISKKYLTIGVLGKTYKLNLKYTTSNNIDLIKKEESFDLVLPKKYKNINNKEVINCAIKKLYSEIAKEELEYSLELVRHILKFAPEDYKIERIENSFCMAKNKVLTINPDIIQYSREVINTTLIRQFCKIKYKTNSKEYKLALAEGIEKYEDYKYSTTKEQLVAM